MNKVLIIGSAEESDAKFAAVRAARQSDDLICVIEESFYLSADVLNALSHIQEPPSHNKFVQAQEKAKLRRRPK